MYKRQGFQGVPTPAVGLVVASLPLIYWTTESSPVYNLLLNKWFLYGLSFLLAWLMVSKLPLLAFKFKDRSMASLMPLFILAGVTIISALLLSWLAVPVAFFTYILVSLIFKSKQL